MARLAVRAKGVDGVLAITDATAGAGLPVGAMSVLGDQPIRVTERCAVLADGTLAGSILTMDGAFRVLVGAAGLGVVDAARICATTPAQRAGTARPGPTRGRRGGRSGGARRCLACHPDLGGRVAGVEPRRPRGRLSTRGGVMASGTGRLVGAAGRGRTRRRAHGVHGQRQHRRRHRVRDPHLQGDRHLQDHARHLRRRDRSPCLGSPRGRGRGREAGPGRGPPQGHHGREIAGRRSGNAARARPGVVGVRRRGHRRATSRPAPGCASPCPSRARSICGAATARSPSRRSPAPPRCAPTTARSSPRA